MKRLMIKSLRLVFNLHWQLQISIYRSLFDFNLRQRSTIYIYHSHKIRKSMIKSIIEKVMIKEFSKYIHGIEYNKLTVEVLGGFFGIEDISLNHDFFNNLQTPLKVTYSHIGKLSIEAPLTKLSSVPVSCTIEDVYVIAEHKKNAVKLSEISKEELLRKYIKETFDALVDKIKDSKKQDGMLDKLGKKILDNLKLQIKNIHIRFQQSNQLHTYSFGISLKSLTFGTTDKHWKPIYMQRQKQKQEEAIFKCMTIQNFKLYWQSISNEKEKYLFLRFPNNNQRIESMRKFVTNDSDSIFNINSIIKLKINPNSFTNQPLFQIEVDLQPIQIKFSKQKIVQILDFTTSCIKYNEVMLKTLLDKAMKKLTHEQEKKYKPLCGKFVTAVLDKQAEKKKDPKQLKELFDNVAIEHLYELSMPEIKQKIQQHRQKEIKKQKKSWFSSAQVQLTSEQKKQVQKLLNQLIEDSVAKGRPHQSILLKLLFNLKGLSFHFYDESKETKLRTIELSIENIVCVLEKSQNKSYFSIESKIKRIIADITLEEDKQLKKIHLMENICEGENEYLIEFIYRQSVNMGKKTTINYFSDLSLRKTLFTYKKEYWKMFNSFFSLPEINQQVQNEAMGKLELLKKESSEDESQQIQIERHYNINLNLNSPTFILPLSPSTCWYLDLGKIAMKSETKEKKFIYPFKLSELNMRYISGQKQINHAQSLLKSKQFFPIIKNIYVQVNMITKTESNIVEFQILLDKIQLNATREQFINLMNIKKFIVGEQKDQIQVHKQQVKNKEELVKKKRLDGKVLKRNKYFYNWIQFYCLFSNNSLMLYPSQKDLIPESIIALRGVKMHKNVQQNESILEISSNNETFYLQFKDKATLQLWQSEIIKNLHELKDFHSLILEGNQEQHKPKRKKKQDLVSIHLRLNQINWNYLNEKGQQFLKISLKKIYFVASQKEQMVETQFKIQKIQIVDKVFDYKNEKYQHLFLTNQLLLNITKTKQSVTKINPTSILIKIQSFDINWKPDALLLIIESVKQFLQIKPTAINKDITRRQIIKSIKNDEDFNSKIEKYNALSTLSKESIKQKRASYLQMNEKDDQIYVKFIIQVENLNVNFIHRQSHIPMFLLTSQKLITNFTTGKVQKALQGSIYSLELYEITGYPQQSYDINIDYEPYCLINKKQSHKGKCFTQFKYTSYEADQIANKERVDSFLSICFAPLTLNYIQEVTFRLIDYFMVQIVLLLNHSEVITVNQDVLKQIISNNSINNERPKNFLESQFEVVIKRFFNPFFMDWSFEFESPEIIMEPIKNNKNYFSLNLENIMVNNSSIKKDRRFSNVKYEFSDNIYEEIINISGSNIIINSIHQDIVTNLVSKPFNLTLEVNRLLFQDEINEITPQITGYDRSFKIENNITAIQITEISKFVYENLLRLPNFNLNYEDGNSELFIHNYRITKMLLPKPIKYKLKIEQISALAKHSLDQIKDIQLKLWSVTIQNFELEMSRDERLNMTIEINFSEANAFMYEYPDFANLSAFNVKELARIHHIKNNKNYAIIKMPNTGIIDIQTCLQSCQLNLNFGILPLIADWVQPDDSVFAISKKQDRLIKFMIRLPRVAVNLQEKNMFGQCMKMVGELTIEVTRKNGESENYLRSGYLKKEIHPNYIEQLNQFMNFKVTLGLQFFTRFNNKDRKILEKTNIQVKQEYYYKIRNDEFRKTVRRRIFVSELKGSMSVDDIILFKSVVKSKEQGGLYQKQFKQILKQAFIKSEKDLEKSIYKDLLSQQKMLQEFVFNVQTIKFYLVYKEKAEYMPILRICTNKISLIEFVNKANQVYNGEFDFQVFYFNDQIFRWEPFVENTRLKLTLTNNLLQTNKFLEAEVSNAIYVNISSQIAVSVKKALKTIETKIQQYNEGNYIPQEGQQYQSRYVIRNQTGYPLEIYDETHKSQFFVMTGESINYVNKKLQGNFFEQNEIKEVYSFLIHHPSFELLEVTNISLESQKSFDIDLYDAKGRKLPEHCRIYLENCIDGWKKISTIRSKKCISDYSRNTLVKKYYPFDTDPTITFTEGVHKGIRANFYTKTKSQRFQYNGLQGNLIIRKSALVYNYTVIPLNVNDNIVIPGEFVGINSSLTIQGKPYKQSFLKVSFNEFKQEYYIYSISYIIDYTGLSFAFEEQYQIKKLYSYEFKQNGKTARVYLLPDINCEFKVRYSKTSSQVKLNGKLSRQQFQIAADNAQYMYASYGRLESFCTNNIKQFKKIIQITNAYQLCNDTTEILLIRQIDTIEKEKYIIKPGQNIIFNWTNRFLRELLLITIVDEKEQWSYASPLPIVKNIDTFVIRNKMDPSIRKIYCLQLQETNNLNFIHILNSQTKYEISNELYNVKVTLYQTAIFQNKDTQFLPKNIDPTVYTYELPPKTKKYFGFQLPIHSHHLTIHFSSITNPQQTQVFSIDDIQRNVIEKNLQLFKNKQKASIKLQFNRKNKKLKFYVKRKEIFKKQEQQLQAKIKIKAIYISLIGIHEYTRKQLINACFGTINLHFIANNQYTEQCLQIQNIRIENTIKPQPYFITLFNQQQDENKLALKFIIKKSRFNPNLIYNIAFSMRKSIITVTSQELQILQQNVNNIMEKVNAKSDTNFFVNFDDLFTPAKLISHSKLYFIDAQLHPLKFILTYKHVNNWGGTLLKALSINNCKMTVNGKKISNFDSHDLLDFFSIMGKYFKQELQNEIFSMIGSLGLLGSPLNLASKIGCGLQNLIELPADGFQDEGFLGVGKGLALGTGSLISNTVQGAFGSVESITGAIGQGISGLASYDKNFQKNRQSIKNQRVDHVGQGLVSGGKSIFNGIFTGITGLVTQPIKGAEKQGLGGFFKGGFKGLTGLIVKPVSGVIDATSKTAEGIKNTTKVFSKQTKQSKTRKYNPRPFYGYYREVRPYDKNLAKWNKQMGLYSAKYGNLSWVNLFPMKNGELVLLSYEYLLVIDKKQFDVRASYESSSILSINVQNQKFILIAKNSQEQKQKVQLQPKQYLKLSAQLFKVFNHFNKNYEIGIDRKSTLK